MRISLTLSSYIAKHFGVIVLLSFAALSSIIFLVDVIELIRRGSSREGVSFAMLLAMSILKLPAQMQDLLPFAVLIGSMFTLTKLTRSHELVVARAAGVSVWQFLFPACSVMLALGVLAVTVFNPLSAVMLLRFEQLEGKYLTGEASMLAISGSGLWLRQVESDNSKTSQHIIHAARLSQADMSFSKVIIFSYDNKFKFRERIDAARAELKPNYFELTDVVRSQPGKPPEFMPSYQLPTNLTIEHIQDSFASPETMPFWALPSFIRMLEEAGFSALRHKLYWHSLLASPLLLVGMMLVAAAFSLRMPRQGRIAIMVVVGLVCGFILYFVTDIVHALGAAGTIPIALAAWTPALIVSILGTIALMHLEDG